ncbi:MAG: right-handed parallel beta-helix repeat-containing protein [Thermoguttaceae bacterium]
MGGLWNAVGSGRGLRGVVLVALAAGVGASAATPGETPAARSIAQLRVAHTLVARGELAAAKAEFARLLQMQDAPAHHREEAEDEIRQIERLQKGLPAHDPAASRTRWPKRPKPAVRLYVAPDGIDANPGTTQRPFATLRRARDEIRSLKRRGGLPPGGVAVLLRGGQYKLTETFQLGPEDSGTSAAPIVYRACEGETPTLTGGIRLAGFQPVRDPAVRARLPEQARDKVLQVDLKAHGIAAVKPLRLGGFASGLGFRTHPAIELFFDGHPMPLARWPNEGFVRVVDVSVRDGHQIHGLAGSKIGQFTYEGDRPKRWKEEKEILLYGYWFFDWADSYERVAAIDADTRQITLAPPYHTYGYRKGQPYYALNLLSEIDAPGEWYLDRAAGILYFYPPSDPDKAAVELSTLEVPFVRMEEVSHVALEGLLLELGCGEAVWIRGGQNCLVAGCTIRRFGGNGIEIHGGTGHGILSCDIYSMGRGGTVVSGGNRKTLAPGRHFVENCHIHGLSRIDHTYTPAVRMTGVGNRIAHNRMHDIRSSAINLTGNDHLVEYNEVFHVVWESDDQGGVDMFGNPTFRGNVYRYNYWHHIGNWQNPAEAPPCGQAGIRLDDAICGTLVYGNVFYRCSAGRLGFGGVQIHGGKDNIVDNNVFVDCMAAISFSPWGPDRWRQFTSKSLDSPEIDKSLYLARYPELARLSEDHDVNMVWRNCVYRCGQFLRRDSGRTRLIDNFITADDPGFTDAAKGVFQLKEGSPLVERIGFRTIPFDQIGLYRDEFRKQLPDRSALNAR